MCCCIRLFYVFAMLLPVVQSYYYYSAIVASQQQSVLEPPCDYAQFSTQEYFQGYRYRAWQINFTLPSECKPENYRVSLVEESSLENIDYVTTAQQTNSNEVCTEVFAREGSRTLQSVLDNAAGEYTQVEYKGQIGVQVGDVTVFGSTEALNVTTYVIFSIVCTERSGDVLLFVQSDCDSNRSALLSSIGVTGDLADDYCYDNNNLTGWEIALIVIGSILGVCLIILMLAIIIDACTPTPEVKTQMVPETVPLQENIPQYYHGTTPEGGVGAGYPPIGKDTPIPQKPPLSQLHTPSSDAPVPPPVVQQSSSHSGWPHTTLQYPSIDDQNVQTQPKV